MNRSVSLIIVNIVVYKTLESQTYLYLETIEEVNSSRKLEPHENLRHKLGSHRCDSRYLEFSLAINIAYAGTEKSDLKRGQRNRWQRRRVVVKSFGSYNITLELNMCIEIV